MAQNESLYFPGPAGRLEGILMHPDDPPVAVAIVCHADPNQGGVMHYKAVFRAAKVAQAHGLAALRFNFRGVGLSEGVHDFGDGEQGDVLAALDFAGERFPGLAVVLGGFSFGSVMALRVGALAPRVAALFALGFPVRRIEDTSFLDECRKPRLFVQGDGDQFGSGAALRALTDRWPEPKSVVVVPDSDHFFTGHLDQMQEAVGHWIAGHPWTPARAS